MNAPITDKFPSFAVHTKNIENKPVVNERDTRPIPKPHFAAVQQAPPRLAAAVLSIPSGSSGGGRPSIAPNPSAPNSRPSSSSSSRVPRPSVGGYAPTTSRLSQLLQQSAPAPAPAARPRKSMPLTDKEIDERVSPTGVHI